MSAPILIVIGALLLFIVALVTFVITLIRAIRRSRALRWEAPPSGRMAADERPVNTSLEGLKVEVSDDAPSASLLTPLRTGEWQPPEEPAPLESLQSASLEDRIAEFRPLPDVADPPFSVPKYEAWEVSAEATEPREYSEPAMAVPSENDTDAELDAEIAALVAEVPARPVTASAPEDSQPEARPEPAPQPQPKPEPQPQLRPEPSPIQWAPPAMETVSVLPPHDEPDDAEYWIAALSEQSTEKARATAPSPPPSPRPEVKVATATAVVPAPEPPEPIAPEPPVPPRPRVRVHVVSAQPDTSGETRAHAGSVSLVMSTDQTDRDLVNPELEMAAPVEMWFGDSRVGVKAGTATYDRFRKYADVLLGELKKSN